MFFLNPTYLWALLGLAVPIAIHLWSKKEGKTIKIGSIQLLSEADSKQNSSIKLNELWLLLIRLILVALVILIMAEPQIKCNTINTKLTYIIEPALFENKSISKFLDTISTEASFRLLQKNFPEFELDNISNLNKTVPNYWQLAQEMDDLHSDSIIVLANGFVHGIKGKRPEINANVEWIILNEDETSEKTIKTIKKGEDIELLTLISDSQSLSFKNDLIPVNSSDIEWNQTKDSLKINNKWQIVNIERPLKVLIFSETTLKTEVRYIEAAFKSISKYLNRPFEIEVVNEYTNKQDEIDYDCVVWLSKDRPFESSGKLLVFKSDKFASSLIVEGPTNNVFHLTRFLNSENIIDGHLPEQLIKMLNLNSDLDATIIENDKRIITKEELQPLLKETQTQKDYVGFLNISKWLWLLLAGLLVLERIIANYRKQ